MKLKIDELNRVTLCCGKAGCPILFKDKEGMVQITDDYGNTVRMQEEEAKLINDALKQLKDK